LTGIGNQNAIVIDRQDSTLDELIGQLNIDKPGVKAFRGGASMPTILQFKMAPGPNLMLPTAPSLPRSIVSGSVSTTPDFSQLWILHCKGGSCRILKQGDNCERCNYYNELCLTYEDLTHIYKKMEVRNKCLAPSYHALTCWCLIDHVWYLWDTPAELATSFQMARDQHSIKGWIWHSSF